MERAQREVVLGRCLPLGWVATRRQQAVNDLANDPGPRGQIGIAPALILFVPVWRHARQVAAEFETESGVTRGDQLMIDLLPRSTDVASGAGPGTHAQTFSLVEAESRFVAST